MEIVIDFEKSHLFFPRIIGGVVVILGIMVLIRDRKRIFTAGAYWRTVFLKMDKRRFFGTLFLTVVYFLLMIPVGRLLPNTGIGFLLCSIPYVMLVGLLFVHQRTRKNVLVLGAVSLVAPVVVWWLFWFVLALTLP